MAQGRLNDTARESCQKVTFSRLTVGVFLCVTRVTFEFAVCLPSSIKSDVENAKRRAFRTGSRRFELSQGFQVKSRLRKPRAKSLINGHGGLIKTFEFFESINEFPGIVVPSNDFTIFVDTFWGRWPCPRSFFFWDCVIFFFPFAFSQRTRIVRNGPEIYHLNRPFEMCLCGLRRGISSLHERSHTLNISVFWESESKG